MCNLNVHRKKFKKKVNSSKKLFFSNDFRTLTKTFLAFCQKNSAVLPKLNSTPPGKVWRTFFYKNQIMNNLSQISSSKLFGKLSKTFRRGCQNSLPRVHWNVLRKNFFGKKNCYRFTTLSKKFLASWRKNVCRVVKTAFYESRRRFLENSFFRKNPFSLSFLDITHKKFGLFLKIFHWWCIN